MTYRGARLRAAAAAATLSLLVAGCGSDDATTTTTTVVSVETTSSTAVATTKAGTTVPSTTVPETTTTTSEPSATSTTGGGGTLIEVTVSDGEVEGGGRVPVELGSTVRLGVIADLTDEVHVHGYDLTAPVTPAQPADLEFTADIPGVFEVELEESGVKLADLEVAP